MKAGDFVRVTSQGETLDAVVLFASPNGKSLALALDGGLPVGDGFCYGVLPIREENGGFEDLFGHPISVEAREPAPDEKLIELDDDPVHYACDRCSYEFIGPARVPFTGERVRCPRCGELPSASSRA